MRLFFQMIVEYAKIKYELRCNYIRFKSEYEIYVYEAKYKIYTRFGLKSNPPIKPNQP